MESEDEFPLMKKKQGKKKNITKKKKISEGNAFRNIEKKAPVIIQKSKQPNGIPTIMGMSVFVVSYIIVTKNIAEIPPSSTIAISALFFLLGLGLSLIHI